jgi:hypothetical protein
MEKKTMRGLKIRVTLSCCLGCYLLGAAFNASAQARKPGLWEVTTTMTWQQSPFPAGMPAGAGAAFAGPHTSQVCLTQAQIDKYGAPLPQTRGDCQVTNMVKKPSGMTADMECTGRMSGKGTLEASWTDDGHATSKMHFVGSMQAGPSPKPVEWTTTSTSVFKGADCGSVQPMTMPPDK